MGAQVTLGKVLFQAQVRSRGGSQATFQIVEGRGHDPGMLAMIYNSVTGTLDRGVSVNPDHMAARLERDRRSVYVGMLDGSAVSIINVVRRAGLEVPDTHQALTDNDTFESTLENGARTWFCPWVAVVPGARGHRFGEGERHFSLGQLHVQQVKTDALADPYVEQLFAYSRLASIRTLLGQFGLVSQVVPGDGRNPVFYLGGERLALAREGIRFAKTGNPVLIMGEYWNRPHTENPKRRFDDIFHFHGSMGAQFRPDLVKPNGHVGDLLSMTFRTPLEHPLEK